MTVPTHPHEEARIATAGPPAQGAAGAAIVLHGRGGSAASMQPLIDRLAPPELHLRLPEAVGHSWYPHGLTAARQSNEPYLSSALAVVERQIAELLAAGLPAERIALLGFSQGAGLTLEAAARQQQRLAGAIALAGGLVGAEPSAADYPGALQGTPCLLAVSDDDPYVPLARADASAAILEAVGATVDYRRYAGLGHWVGEDALGAAGALLAIATG